MKKIFRTFSIVVSVMGLVVAVQLVKEIANLKGKAAGTPANLVVDLSSTFTPINSWQFLAQGGEEQGRSLAPIVSEVKDLKPQYIRIDHVFDFFHVVSGSPGNISYNWSELDTYIKDITATGSKPFLALSYTPNFLGEKDTDMPNLSLWTNLVKATIEHVSGRNGLSLSEVYYEVWNEPDLFGEYKVYPPKNYLDLYKASSDGAKAAQNTQTFKFGGPATTSLYKNWFDALVKLSDTQNVRFDFFSWHQYGLDTELLDRNIKDVLTWRALAKKDNLELFITENGIDGGNNVGYDSSLGAIHTLSAAAISADKVNGLFTFEIKDGPGPTQLWGRWGLLTHEKFGTSIKKPRYSAIEFINSMALGERVNIAGNGSWVSAFGRQDKKGTRLFVVNYDPESKHVEAVKIHFTNIPYEKFTLSRSDFMGKSTQIQVVPVKKEYQTVQYFKANSAAIFQLSETK